MQSSIWAKGAVIQAVAALMRLALGVLFAWMILKNFGVEQAGYFWAKAVIYQIAFSFCSFGLPYGIILRSGKDYCFYSLEVKAAVLFTLMAMVLLYAVIWFVFDRNMLGLSVGLHFMINRLVYIVIFFRRNALHFEKALYWQLIYDISIVLLLLVFLFLTSTFKHFIIVLLFINLAWLVALISLNKLFNISFIDWISSVKKLFNNWYAFSGKTYFTEVIGLVMNGADRLIITILGYTDFLAVYVLARKFYEVPHNIMVTQSSFVFAILTKITCQPNVMRHNKMMIMLGYEGFALVTYSLLWLFMLLFNPMGQINEIGISTASSGLIGLFIIIGFAQASMIPLQNITYANGNSRFIMNYTISNAFFGGGLLLLAYVYESLRIVLISQDMIVWVSLIFMVIFMIQEFGLKRGAVIAFLKVIVLIILHTILWSRYIYNLNI